MRDKVHYGTIPERPSYLGGRGLKPYIWCGTRHSTRRAPVLLGRARIETREDGGGGSWIVERPSYLGGRGLKLAEYCFIDSWRGAPVLLGRARIETLSEPPRTAPPPRAPVLLGRARIETCCAAPCPHPFRERPSYLGGRGLKLQISAG